jgi:hypothetical protein
MGLRFCGFFLMVWAFTLAPLHAAPKPPACRMAVIEGELNAGQEFTQLLGNGLKLWFQPVASGWILRVVPASGPPGDHDYAELATPPYQSVTPLSLSTDFAFRAQDAVGWNPRRFRFAASRAEFDRLDELYQQLIHAGATPPATLETELAAEVGQAAAGKLTILDARLVPGMADQWRMAAAVSQRFPQTAHTLVPPPDGKDSPLGKLVWIRFRVELELPPGFHPETGLRVVPHLCGNL